MFDPATLTRRGFSSRRTVHTHAHQRTPRWPLSARADSRRGGGRAAMLATGPSVRQSAAQRLLSRRFSCFSIWPCYITGVRGPRVGRWGLREVGYTRSLLRTMGPRRRCAQALATSLFPTDLLRLALTRAATSSRGVKQYHSNCSREARISSTLPRSSLSTRPLRSRS